MSFHLGYSFLCFTKASKFNQVSLVYFCFYSHYSRRWVTEDLALIYVIKCLPMFSSKSFIVSGLTFRSFIYFEFIFVYGVRKCSISLLHEAVHFSQHHLLKRLSLPHSIFLPPLSKNKVPIVACVTSGLSILFHWSIFLFLCHCHTVLMTVALLYNLKSGRLIPPAPFFFLKTALVI